MAEKPQVIEDAGGRAGELASGRDEMNLAEFPLTLLADRVPGEIKTLCYVSRPGTLVVTGSDAFGLPTAADADVIIGLIQLTRLRNDFADPKVPFTRYELLRILGWPDESRYYRRLDESLNRWVGVTLHYQNAWWDNRAKRYLSAKMHILESVILDEKPGRRVRGAPPVSSFTWNKTFIESCQADNLKRLDLDTYFSFRSAVTKRMYRFLDKRFYLKPDWTFDLKEFAFEYVGLSRGYEGNAGKVKEKLQPALEELEAIAFLEPMGREERYAKAGASWTIRLAQHPSRAASPGVGSPAPALALALAGPADAPAPPPGLAALVERGVTEATAQQIVEQFPAERVAAKVAIFDWLASRDDRRVRKSPAGYLVDSIRKDYAPPKGYAPAVADAPRSGGAPAPASTARAARGGDAALRGRVERYWEGLGPAARERLTAEALAAAGAYFRGRYLRLRGSDPARAEKCLRAILDEHLAGLVSPEPAPEAVAGAGAEGPFRLVP